MNIDKHYDTSTNKHNIDRERMLIQSLSLRQQLCTRSSLLVGGFPFVKCFVPFHHSLSKNIVLWF